MTQETSSRSVPGSGPGPLTGRHALITGASSGIGAATARALCRAGATVVLTARRAERLAELQSELNAARADSATVATCDVRKAVDLARVFDAEEAAGRPVDLVVANAGLGLGVSPIQEGDPEDWSTMIDTNVKGVLHTVRAALPTLRGLGRGDLVLLGSVAGRQVYPGGNVYNATKHAVKAIYDALRLDNVGSGIRFTTVDPGMVETEFSVVRLGDQARADAVYVGMQPLRPEDVADAITYAVTRPAHVNIGEIVLWPTDQASTRDVHRSN
ncbi:Sulfoacetaldehyde reductase 2 [Planctomycetes bacterium Poly30]|uniref:Sulfoacetaldehyde reductase 2 n=1 Tax=Saltatorellus ferox TaxID=2528018 RepID=A0A518ETN8_9BACT|nr:Sulfoacetaldehyde reductase 2 [Planctomycetes bacterium Poly30]